MVANNRYYAHCPGCKENKYLAKSLGVSDWNTKILYENALYSHLDIGEELGTFITKHMWCLKSEAREKMHSPEWHDGTFVEIISEYDERIK